MNALAVERFHDRRAMLAGSDKDVPRAVRNQHWIRPGFNDAGEIAMDAVFESARAKSWLIENESRRERKTGQQDPRRHANYSACERGRGFGQIADIEFFHHC